jgi:branched-chain amino acid transport system substrate-binding protein
MHTEFADKKKFPSVFVPGPTYEDQLGMLVRYVKRKKKNAKIVFVHSGKEFGRVPIPHAREAAKRAKLNVLGQIEVSFDKKDVRDVVERLVKMDPEYVILQGFIVNPVPQLVKGCRDRGMKCHFLATSLGMNKRLLDTMGPSSEGLVGVYPYSYWWMDAVPMMRKIKEYTAKRYPEVTFRDNAYMMGYVSGLILIEAAGIADKDYDLSFDGLVKGLHSIKNLDTGGLTAPLTIRNNRFPVATLWRANPEKKTFEPMGFIVH